MYKLLIVFFTFWLAIANGISFAVDPESLQKSLEKHIHFSEGANTVGHLYIGGHEKQISEATVIYVKDALDFYKKNKPAFIILELNSPGGQVFAAQKISDILKDIDIHFGIPVVAVINNWAISAGAMLAYSCRYIAVVKDGSMGAAEPITQTGEKTSEKVNSAIRADFGNRAGFFDRNPLIAEAMVDADMVLVIREGQVVKLKSDDEIQKEDVIVTTKGKLLTLKAKEMVDWGVADFLLMPTKLIPLTAQEKESGQWPAFKELLFTVPFFQRIPQASVKAFQMDWKTRFFSFLASPAVASILFLTLIICTYVELNTPGFGIPGVIGLIALFFILLSSFALHAINWFEVILFVVGIVLLLVEVFVLPGFGFVGVVGILLALIGLLGLLLPNIKDITFDIDTQTLNAAGEYFFEKFAWLAGALVVGVVMIAMLTRYIAPRLQLFSPLVHRGEQEKEKGYVAGLGKEDLPSIGEEGVVVSSLRPAGKVRIREEVYDAISSGGFIDEGKKIQVIAIEGSKIIVEANR